ncbi:ATP-binding cassette domain-containing protein [Hydrogenovibrio kuenenii]|uniref:ATP-binding cassette domain-containing protein n=1 Tax=Hydrogenovibrio kuenenii TaxID=63658 RepID=UPI0004637890|nr:ATP-binding cassette domain-containing protein [Hydrogenovibrio kuenenii]
MTDSTAPIIIEKLSKRFTLPNQTIDALSEVSFQLKPGQVTGLIGADGAGKTTLMRLVAGLLQFEEGRIQVLGTDVAEQPLAVQSTIGYMPQQFGLYQDLTVRENLSLYADLQGVPRGDRVERFELLLSMMGMNAFYDRLAGNLSGGMKQKLGLACTLVKAPRLLLLDEPTVGVDPVSRRELWQIVYQLVEEEGMSVLLSTAYLDEAERCHDIKLLHQGKLLAEGPPNQFSDPMRQRTFLVSHPEVSKRELKKQLDALPMVKDALIFGDALRVLTTQTLESPHLLSEALQKNNAVTDYQVEPVAPRFEDAFVDRLAEEDIAPHEQTLQNSDSSSEKQITESPSDDMPAIEVKDLVCKFGDFVAVDHLTFKVKRGEIFGLLGANGAGKTTTFRMLCGLLPATSGHLEVVGLNLRHARAQARAKLGYMSQKFSLYGVMTVAQNLAFYSQIYGLKGKQKQQRIAWAVETFDLKENLTQSSHDLPLGFKQRMAMACALMHEPDILFLDEPTSGVDPLGRRDFWDKINALADQGVTVMVTTHFMEEAEYCDRMAIMAEGKILSLGTPSEIKDEMGVSDMEEAFVRMVQGAKHQLPNEVEEAQA